MRFIKSKDKITSLQKNLYNEFFQYINLDDLHKFFLQLIRIRIMDKYLNNEDNDSNIEIETNISYYIFIDKHSFLNKADIQITENDLKDIIIDLFCKDFIDKFNLNECFNISSKFSGDILNIIIHKNVIIKYYYILYIQRKVRHKLYKPKGILFYKTKNDFENRVFNENS